MTYLMAWNKKIPLFVWDYDRKISPLWSPFVVTRQASWFQLVILGADFLSDPHTHDISLYFHTDNRWIDRGGDRQ